MGSPLLWRSCAINHAFYKNILKYDHKITLDGKQQRFLVEKRTRPLVPFLISFIPPTVELCFAFIVLIEFFRGNPSISNFVGIFNAVIASLIFLLHGLNYVFIQNANDLCNLYFNSLLALDLHLNWNDHLPESELGTLQLINLGEFNIFSNQFCGSG